MNITQNDDRNLYADSGETTHIINDPGKLLKLAKYKGDESIIVSNGDNLHISHIGEGKIETNDKVIKLKYVLVALKIKKNLKSVAKLTSDNACTVIFDSNCFLVKSQQGKVLAKGYKHNGLYALDNNHKALAA